MARFAMVLHGGAGAKPGVDYSAEIAHMRELIERGRARLAGGAAALDVAVETVAALEASGLYVAGRGAFPNSLGRYELDASVMDGATRQAGGVTLLEGFKSPIEVARRVMDKTPHVLLGGMGAAAFAETEGLERIEDPKAWFTHAAMTSGGKDSDGLSHGTVGCVVLDAQGRLAAGTSTAGVFGKRPGRIGDTPLPAAGTWADDRVAVSGTGLGEYFIRTAACAQVSWRMAGGQSLDQACRGALDEIAALGGDGGLIAVAADGSIAHPWNSKGMKRAWLTAEGEIGSAAFAV
ncbi:isoaspartyl peptidase/L-asparaginase [Brevundimonas sp. 2R-24]|uniref:Isoaspartyl peptidase/L-asparaginase n=1 Tax=Peiella sedimenti TaxID=3061083 RepID=A0ABT8SL77_9CAUL|nr:isoaspartyl peptidase/L-asparaginase [Caulobacteraceae bacterium XZ-24]